MIGDDYRVVDRIRLTSAGIDPNQPRRFQILISPSTNVTGNYTQVLDTEYPNDGARPHPHCAEVLKKVRRKGWRDRTHVARKD